MPARPSVPLQALSRTDKVAVVKYALRGRERLGLLRPVGEALSFQGLHWDDEIRSPAELAPPETDVSEKEIEGALTLMETMTVDSLDDLDVTDHYTEALHEVIEAKAEHREPAAPEAERGETAPVVDLMAALEASVAKAKESRGESGEPATVHELPKPKKKTAAKKTAAKKSAAKKTTAKKTDRRKSA
ncbi:Ku protein [Streptomyces sp. NPDC057695]|uniref:Ku protein n=1 Tax=Streptomyces sp. NPDC057695 TaxID=3346217 RepID=UPI0036CCFDB2